MRYPANHTHVSVDADRESDQVAEVSKVLSGSDVLIGCDGAV